MSSLEVPSSPLGVHLLRDCGSGTKSECLLRLKLSHRDLDSLGVVCLLITYSSFIDWFLDCLFSLVLHQYNHGFE